MRLYLTLIGLCITIQMQAQAQFAGHSGVYFLGSANVPISTSSFSNPNINGAVVRFRWNDLEPNPGIGRLNKQLDEYAKRHVNK